MEHVECASCHEDIEEARAYMHEKVNKVLAHHGRSAEILIITKQDEGFADQSLSHLDRVMQWTLGKLPGRSS